MTEASKICTEIRRQILNKAKQEGLKVLLLPLEGPFGDTGGGDGGCTWRFGWPGQEKQ